MKFITKFTAGEMTLTQARHYAFKHLENNPGASLELFQAGIISQAEATYQAMIYLRGNPYQVFAFVQADLIPKEAAQAFAFKASFERPEYLTQGIEQGVFTVQEARSMAQMIVQSYPYNIDYYLAHNLFDPQEAKPYILNLMTQGSLMAVDVYKKYIDAGWVTQDEAKEVFLERYHSTIASALFENNLVTPIDVMLKYPHEIANLYTNNLVPATSARQYALMALEDNPSYVESYLAAEIISHKEAAVYFLKMPDTHPSTINSMKMMGEISPQQAKEFALAQLETLPSHVVDYFSSGIITQEEALAYAIKGLEQDPGRAETYEKVKLLTLKQVRPYALKAVSAGRGFSLSFLTRVQKPFGNDNYLNQLVKDGVDIDAMIDPDLKHLLDSF